MSFISPPLLRRPVQVLSANVAERIAAGEVIERPASVVKEMVENSLDAGATEICVALEGGGKSLIEITDNGHGMSPADLALCVRRHATSKLSSIGDLEKIRTLGFRGEALPSVAAVSELSIVSRTRTELSQNDEPAYELKLPAVSDQDRFEDREFKPEAITFGHFLNSPHGTRIRARGLFAHIPARLKFLKAQGAEVSQVREWIERLALAHPYCSFRLLSDGRQVLQLRAQSEEERVRAILADGEDYPILSAANNLGPGAGAGLHIRVRWLQGLSSPQMKRMAQVVNGRAVRDRMIQQALMSPFRQALLPGQFPAVAVFIDIDPAQLDVNVHPTKTEIRFLDSRKIFHEIDQLIRQLIVQEGAPAFAAGPSHAAPASVGFSLQNETHSAQFKASDWSQIPSFRQQLLAPSDDVPHFPTPTNAAIAAPSVNPLEGSRFAGVLFNTYLLYERGPELILIDQHAAHERIRYEYLQKRALNQAGKENATSQVLLLPEAARFPAEHKTEIESRLIWLEQMGFEVEIFGEDTLLFRAVPGEWGTHQLRTRLKNLVDRLLSLDTLSTGGTPSSLALDEALFEVLASEACHSAVRAGDRLEPEEIRSITEQLFQCTHPWNCPHGRPTVVRVPESRLEEWFLRRV